MYADSGLILPYFQNFSPDVHQYDDFCHPQKPNASLESLVQTSDIPDYDLGSEGYLFKGPESIIDQPLVTLDPRISCGEDTISQQELHIESLQSEKFLNDVFYECKDILTKEAVMETSPLSEVLNFGYPFATDDKFVAKEKVHPTGQFPKSVSSDSLNSMDWIQGAQIRPNFLSFAEIDIGNAYGMRRAFSEGDIKTLSNGNTSLGHSPLGQPQLPNDHGTEDRWQKLSRYRDKKTKRNFGRKIKYACRKALADSQPRIRGRFAKTEETEMLRK